MRLRLDLTLQRANTFWAFTLVEVLVVIVIVGLLAALLGAVFGRARATAKSSACVDNMHQIGVALVMYANDNGGYAPPVLTRPEVGADGKLQVTGDIQRWRDLLLTFTKSDKVFFCPADPYPGTSTPNPGIDKANSLYTSYETTEFMNGDVGPNHSLRLNIDVPRDASVPYANDRMFYIRDDSSSNKLGYTISTFHGDVGTCLFLDAHAKSGPFGRSGSL